MRLLGMIGGLGWPSTVEYYTKLNTLVERERGTFHSAPLLLFSLEFAPILRLQGAGRWQEVGDMMCDTASQLEKAGAQGLILCSNTMHTVADRIEDAVGIPLLHVADAVASVLAAQGVKRAGLLGTRYTMEGSFYSTRLEERFEIEVLTPEKKERDRINSIIYNQLAKGIITDASKEVARDAAAGLEERGAQALIVGCTELPMVLSQNDVGLPLFETLPLHMQAAADFILDKEE
jgi:aspartate racemase